MAVYFVFFAFYEVSYVILLVLTHKNRQDYDINKKN